MKGVVKLFKVKKAISQIGFLAAGVVMLCYGAMRGEADTVLSKAIRLCLECIGIGKKKKECFKACKPFSYLYSGRCNAFDKYSFT